MNWTCQPFIDRSSSVFLKASAKGMDLMDNGYIFWGGNWQVVVKSLGAYFVIGVNNKIRYTYWRGLGIGDLMYLMKANKIQEEGFNSCNI